MVVTVNNDDSDFTMTVPAGNAAEYIGALSGQKVRVENGNICVNVKANSGEIWLPVTDKTADKLSDVTPVELHVEDAVKNQNTAAPAAEKASEPVSQPHDKSDSEKTPGATATPADNTSAPTTTPVVKTTTTDAARTTATPSTPAAKPSEHSEEFERGKIAGLQEAILAIMEKNGPVTDQMRKDVTDNVYHDSLIVSMILTRPLSVYSKTINNIPKIFTPHEVSG